MIILAQLFLGLKYHGKITTVFGTDLPHSMVITKVVLKLRNQGITENGRKLEFYNTGPMKKYHGQKAS
jgi:hypothetical protein